MPCDINTNNWLIGDVFMLLVQVPVSSLGIKWFPVYPPVISMLLGGAKMIGDAPISLYWIFVSPPYDGIYKAGKSNMLIPSDALTAGSMNANANSITISILI